LSIFILNEILEKEFISKNEVVGLKLELLFYFMAHFISKNMNNMSMGQWVLII
jgi:hypothetical protein